MVIEKCELLEELFEDERGTRMLLPGLKKLKVKKLKKLKHIPFCMLPSLRSLVIIDCPLRGSSKFLIPQRCFRQLEELCIIRSCDGLDAIVGDEEGELEEEADDPLIKEIRLHVLLPSFFSTTTTHQERDIRLPCLESLAISSCFGIIKSLSSSGQVLAPKLASIDLDDVTIKLDRGGEQQLDLTLRRWFEVYKVAEDWPATSQHHQHTNRHLLIPQPWPKAYTCDACNQIGSPGWLYVCYNDCEFKAHPGCVLDESKVTSLMNGMHEEREDWPKRAQHVFHVDCHPLILRVRRKARCDACHIRIELFSYYCERCRFDVHPECVLKHQRRLLRPPQVLDKNKVEESSRSDGSGMQEESVRSDGTIMQEESERSDGRDMQEASERSDRRNMQEESRKHECDTIMRTSQKNVSKSGQLHFSSSNSIVTAYDCQPLDSKSQTCKHIKEQNSPRKFSINDDPGAPLVGDATYRSFGEHRRHVHDLLRYLPPKKDFFNLRISSDLLYYEQELEVKLFKSDLVESLKGTWLNISIIHLCILFLDCKMQELELGHTGFLCPKRCSYTSYKSDPHEFMSYLQNGLSKCYERGMKHVCIPYHQGDQWVLLVVLLQRKKILLMDPLSRKHTRDIKIKPDLNVAFLVVLDVHGVEIEDKVPFEIVNCPGQPHETNSGYIVMQYMYDIATLLDDDKDLLGKVLPCLIRYTNDTIETLLEEIAEFVVMNVIS